MPYIINHASLPYISSQFHSCYPMNNPEQLAHFGTNFSYLRSWHSFIQQGFLGSTVPSVALLCHRDEHDVHGPHPQGWDKLSKSYCPPGGLSGLCHPAFPAGFTPYPAEPLPFIFPHMNLKYNHYIRKRTNLQFFEIIDS